MLASANISVVAMDIPTPEELITTIESFLGRHGMAPTRFGRDAVGDPNLLTDLREGRRMPGLGRLNRMDSFMRSKNAELAADHADAGTPPADGLSAGNVGSPSRRETAHA